mgnify:CR=1 FL=1
MKDCFITFRSVTFAQRGESELRRGGIACSVRRTPRWMEERGCGYGVEVKCPDLKAGLEVLRREKIPFRKSYLLHADGVTEELRDDLP